MSTGSEKWRDLLAPYCRSFQAPQRGKTALLVVDMQDYFSPVAEPILASLSRLVEACRAGAVPVLFTRHSHKDPEKDGGMLGEWWEDLIRSGTADAEFIPAFVPLPEEKTIDKNRYNAFYGTDLEEHLRSLGVKDLIIGGVMTNLCCETTARDAFVRDFRVYFLVDGTATASEDLHLSALRNLAFGFAYLVTCKEMERAILEEGKG